MLTGLQRARDAKRAEVGRAVADGQVDKLIESLEATFDARLAREEDEAASDLAFSLLQDGSLPDALRRAGPMVVLSAGGARAPVTELGENFVACGPDGYTLLPLERAVIATAPDGRPPTRTDATLLVYLRRLARTDARVEVRTPGSAVVGRLIRACADHAVVRHTGADVYVGSRAIEEIKVLSRSSS